jgi:hypothetical protein
MAIQNKGVEILLSRMESHPEEFTEGTRWEWIISKVLDRVQGVSDLNTLQRGSTLPLPFLTDEEVKALYDKYMSLQGDVFSKRVMAELLRDDSDQRNTRA